MPALQRIRRKVSNGQFIVGTHVFNKLEELGLTVEDVFLVVKYGEIVNELTDDPRGTRYVILGKATEGVSLGLVCRFLETGQIIFITCYDLY